jgi:hypothetical protein
MDPVTAIINDIQSTLPRMSDYITNHIDRNVPSEAMQGQDCLICQQEFDPNQDEGCFTSTQDNTCIRLPPCNHLFHAHCIQTWLDSTQPTRNSCPTCRTPFCKLNVLDPIQQATLDSQLPHNQAGFYSIPNHASILTFVDARFASQGAGDLANYVGIPRATRDFWENSGNDVVCSEHFSVGLHWVEMAAADRVKEFMIEAGVVKTWPGVQFMGMWTVMTGQFQRSHPAAVRFSFLVRDAAAEDGQDAGQDSREDGQGDASGGSTVVDDGLYARHPRNVQGLVQGLIMAGEESDAVCPYDGTTIAEDDLYADFLAQHPSQGKTVDSPAQENASGVDAAAPETPPNKPATFSLIGAQHGKGFECVRWLHSNLPGSPTPAIDEPKTTEWIHEAHVDQSAPTSFASNAIGWHAQRPVSESIVCDDPTEDEEYGEDGMLLDAITPTRRAGSTTPTTQWVTMPTFPPVRPVPEPIDDFVQLPAPTPAEARWMARVERRRRVPRNGRRVYRPMGMWRKY